MWFRAFMTGLTLALFLPRAALGESRVFRTSFVESVNARMTAVQLGNFDGDPDNKTDVAVTTENGELAVLFNDQNNGTVFFDPSTIPVGAFPAGMVQADFDEDEVPDLVVSNANSGEIVFLKGLHDSSYFDFPSIPIEVGESPRGLAAADIDGDHHLDLVVANQGPDGAPGSVSILKGDGQGNFTVVLQSDPTPEDPNRTVEALPSDSDTQAVAIGNVGGNAELDIVAVNTRSNTMTVFIGHGDLTFDKAVSTHIGAAPQDLLLVDLDDDSKLDLVTADSNDDVVSIFAGDGNGSFGPRRMFRAGTFPNSLAMGDLNGDTRIDLVVSNGRSGDVSVLFGEGGGQFATARTFVSDAEPRAVAVGNIDADEHEDVVAVHAEAGTVAVLRNDGTGGLLGVEDMDVEGAPSSVAVADVDNDGLPDLVVANEGGIVATLRARASGGFAAATTFDVGGRPQGIVAADLNRDGRIDIAVADNDGGCAVAFGQRDGSFGTVNRFATGAQPAGIAAGDFNADGLLDLAVSAIGPPGEVSVLIQQANRTFAAPVSVPVDDTPTGIATGDLNGDHRDDFVVANTSGNTVSIVVSQANGTFRKMQTISPEVLSNGSPDTVAIADFDGDQKPDFAVGLRIAGQGQPTVRVFKGAGDGTVSPIEPGVQAGLIITSLVARDFTGDRVVDLGVLNETDNGVRVLCGSGSGSFVPRQSDQVSRRPVFLAAGDFDGDGRYDAATVNNDASSNNASVLSNCIGTVDKGDCISISEPSASQCIHADIPVPARGDGNGDGIRSAADLVALAAEIADGDGEQVEDIAVVDTSGIAPNAGVDANGDGRVDRQDELALAYRIFSGT